MKCWQGLWCLQVILSVFCALRMFISPCIWFSPLGHLVRKDIWPVGASGPKGHLARWGIWSERTSGPLGHLVRWGIWSVGTSSPLERMVRWDIWPVGTSGPSGHLVDDERLALVEHLAVKWRLVRIIITSGPKGPLGQRRRWYIWRREAHVVHLPLEGKFGTSGTFVIGRIPVKVEICWCALNLDVTFRL